MKKTTVKILSAFCASILAVNAAALNVFAADKTLSPDLTKADDNVLYWADQIGEDKMMWSDSPTGFTVAGNGYLYICSADNIKKIDKFTGKEVLNGKMAGKAMYATKGPVYADGKVFMALDGGKIQAFDAETLTSLWVYTNKNGGKPTCDIVVENGYLYTGFWNSDEADADFVKVSAADEDTEKTDEEKTAEWEYTNAGGFYWTSAVVYDGKVTFGVENGKEGANEEGENNRTVTVDDATGELISKLGTAHDDIRSKLVLKDGVIYYTSREGGVHLIDTNGEAYGYGITASLLGPNGFTCTSTPIVENGRVYVTFQGTGWDDYNGSHIGVFDIVEVEGKIKLEPAYAVETSAECKAKGVFAGVDKEGYNVIYYVENGTSGVVRMLRDKAGMTAPADTVEETDLAGKKHTCPPVVFRPQGGHAQYCAVDPVYDEETGLLYIRNDSFNILAIGSGISDPDIQCPDITIHPNGVKTFVFKADETPADKEYTVDIKNGPVKTIGDITGKDLTFSVDKFSADDEVLTASFSYGLYNGNGKAPSVSQDIDVLVAENDDQYKRALAHKGDVNGDGKVNITDLAIVAANIKSRKVIDKYSFNAADVNADGKVNVSDITLTAANIKGKKLINKER